MSKEKCTRCNGTGWASAARDAGMQDAPFMSQPIGIYECSSCGGSGAIGFDIEDIPEETRNKILESMKKSFEKICKENEMLGRKM